MTHSDDTGTVITAAGRGRFERRPEAGRRPDDDDLLISLDDGRHFTAPAALLTQQPDGEHYLNLPLGEIRVRLQTTGSAEVPARTNREEMVLPVVEESVAVGVREVERGRVRVTKTVREVEDQVETLLQREEVDVERVPVNEYVEAANPPEFGEERSVIPIYEEVVVVEKRLLLREKLVITRRRVEERDVRPVTRRVEEAIVERVDGSDIDTVGDRH